MTRLANLSLLLLLAGCADNRPRVELASDFDAQALDRGMAPGTSTITGQAFWITDKGMGHDAVNETVTVLPGTPYVLECARAAPDTTSHCMDRLEPYRRSTKTDAQGRFTFAGLHQGSYIVTTTVCWAAGRRRMRPCHAVQGEAAIERDEQTVTVVLSPVMEKAVH